MASWLKDLNFTYFCFFFLHFIHFVHTYLGVCVCQHTCAGVREQLLDSLTSIHMGPGDPTQLFSLGGKLLYLRVILLVLNYNLIELQCCDFKNNTPGFYQRLRGPQPQEPDLQSGDMPSAP